MPKNQTEKIAFCKIGHFGIGDGKLGNGKGRVVGLGRRKRCLLISFLNFWKI
jgi:hypothetical protein